MDANIASGASMKKNVGMRLSLYCSTARCPHRATCFELRHGRLRLAIQFCPFHFEELARLVRRQGKDWSATRGRGDWIESRLWAASQGLKSGL